MGNTPTWTLGLDLGSNSLGYAAVKYDSSDIPTEILYAGSIIHDGGQARKASYKAKAGTARRTRNRYKQLRANRHEMDALLKRHTLPHGSDVIDKAVDALGVKDIFDVRALAASKKITNKQHRALAAAAVVRHLQTRRGYRNSWLSESYVLTESKDGYSDQYRQLHDECSAVTGRALGKDLTPAQLLVAARAVSREYSTKVLPLSAQKAVRKEQRSVDEAAKNPSKPIITVEDALAAEAAKTSSPINEKDIPKLLGAIERRLLKQSLRRSDFIRELHAIADVQGLDADFIREAASLIIFNVHPSKGVDERVKLDDLPLVGARTPRAPKATLVFQQYRITAQVANLRHVDGSRLSHDEQDAARTLLLGWDDTETLPTWTDVAEAVGAKRFAKDADLGKPNVNTTALRVLGKGGVLKRFWTAPTTTDAHRSVLVGILIGDASVMDRATAAGSHVQAWMDTLSDKDIADFETLKFEAGRASHSEPTMLMLTAFMQDAANSINDLHTARGAVFGVTDTWRPTPSPLGTPVGNPTVDANLKLIRRVFDMLVARIGSKPSRVVLESARDIVNSASSRQKIHKSNSDRKRDKDASLKEALEKYDAKDVFGSEVTGVGRSNTMRLILLHEQHGQCLYCGTGLKASTMEVDHIVPVSRGGTNTRKNLAATCRPCNGSKGDTPFAQWATEETFKDTVERIKKMSVPTAKSAVARRKWINAYTAQLKATECERPMESLSWAAIEARDQLEGVLGEDSRVLLVSGRITSDVRHIGGIDTEKKPILLRYPGHDVKGKSRLDRRHHAIDAAVLTAIRQSTITVVSERNLLREQARLATTGKELPNVTWDEDGVTVTGRWDTYTGGAKDRFAFAQTRNALDALRGLLSEAVAQDRVPVTRVTRWTPRTGGIHEEKVRPLDKRRLGDALPAKLIDRASSPALWTALTRLPDYNEKTGLPADSSRKIQVKGTHLEAGDTIGFFPGNGGAVEVRGGYAAATGIHHVRVLSMPSGTNKDGTTKYAVYVMPVLTLDAVRLHQQRKDVFTTPLVSSSMSVRGANPSARKAFENTTSWGITVPGDEIVLTPEQCEEMKFSFTKEFLAKFPRLGEYRFVVNWFGDGRLVVSPAYLSSEGAPEEAKKTLFNPDARFSATSVCGLYVSRRNILGEENSHVSASLRSGIL